MSLSLSMCTILYCSALYRIVRKCTILHYTVLHCTALCFKATECKHGRVDCMVGLDSKRRTMDHIPSSTRSRGESNKLTEINSTDLDFIRDYWFFFMRLESSTPFNAGYCSGDSLLLSASPGTFRRGYRLRSH
jgi:hypothetical protein